MPHLVQTPRRAALLVLVIALLAVLAPATAQAATERARITWNTETDIDLHVYDEAGSHAFYAQPDAIPSATLSSDNTVGFGPETFTDDESPGTARTFRLEACYFADPSEVGPTTVSGTITNGDGSTAPVALVLNAVGECADLGTSTGHRADSDGDGILDGADRCPTQPAPGTADGCPPPENRPPVAVSERWTVTAGGFVYDNALKNDHDPDGDSFTPRVTSISFRATEWSGMEQNGTFNYVSGPGTRVHQRKVITYHLVDARGARSAPATITIDVIPPGKRRKGSPGGRGGARSSAAGIWYSSQTYVGGCYGSGFDTSCYYLMAPAQVHALNAATPWFGPPSPAQAARACATSFRGGGVPRCVATLTLGFLMRAGDKQIIRVSAQDSDCLLVKLDLNRTPLHPLAGSWTKPQYHQVNSYVRKGTFATWGKWQLPMYCTAGAAWKKFPADRTRR